MKKKGKVTAKITSKIRPGYRNPNLQYGRGTKSAKNDAAVVLHRQAHVAECYLKGMTQVQVVEELKRRQIDTSQPTVSNDLRDIFERWERECITDFEKARLREIEGLNQLEKFAWDELEFSRERRITVKPAKGDKDQEVKVVVERQQASTEWHDQALKCVDRRVELLQLVKRVVNNNTQVNIVDAGFWSSMSEAPQDDPIEAKIAGVKFLNTNKETA